MSGTESALLDVRVFPWRPRVRVLSAGSLRDVTLENGATFLDGGEGLLLSLAVFVGVVVLAPLIVVVLAVVLFSVELPLILALAALFLVVRFAGILPWQVLVVDAVTGEERHESYRFLPTAILRVRTVNHDRRVRVRWAIA